MSATTHREADMAVHAYATFVRIYYKSCRALCWLGGLAALAGAVVALVQYRWLLAGGCGLAVASAVLACRAFFARPVSVVRHHHTTVREPVP